MLTSHITFDTLSSLHNRITPIEYQVIDKALRHSCYNENKIEVIMSSIPVNRTAGAGCNPQ